MSVAKQELRDLIRSKITDGMTPDQAADAVAAMFYRVQDDWEQIDISTAMDGPGGRVLDQRSLIAWVPREAKERLIQPDRTVTSAPA